jgi:hypothetical protein
VGTWRCNLCDRHNDQEGRIEKGLRRGSGGRREVTSLYGHVSLWSAVARRNYRVSEDRMAAEGAMRTAILSHAETEAD